MITPDLLSHITGQHLAIVGRTGSGKTYTAKGLVEQLLTAQRRVCIVDPTGAWWGVRSSADGKHAGFPVAVFGGEHADVPIVAGSGAALAELIATRNMPAVIDLSEFLIGDRHHFMEDFAGTLYRANRTPLHIIIDEADEFAPQNPLPETKRMLHQVDRIVRRGRIRGFRVMLITQRPAVLHKNVLTQANTLIAMRLTAPQDRKAIEDWIKGQADLQQGKDVLNSLARLQRGEGWVWAPEQDVLKREQFPRIRTFDSSRTPEDGEQIEAPTKLADVDLDAIRGSLAEAEKDAKENDPKALRTRVAELERQLARAGGSSPAELAAEYARGRGDGFVDGRRDGYLAALERVLADLKLSGELWRQEMVCGEILAEKRDAPAPVKHFAQFAELRKSASSAGAPAPPIEGVSRSQQKILESLAMLEGVGIMQPSRTQLALWAEVSSTSGGYFNNLGALRTAGLIDYPSGGTVALTDEGRARAPTPRAMSVDEMQASLCAKVGNSKAAIVRALIDIYPRHISRDALARKIGVSATSGGYFNNLGALRTLGVIDYPSPGNVVALPVLFLER